ncbi:hypothetical protein [Sediminitomix flava]|uniref:Uncharacterized protein n=1 Tax=Sediminitomix flava TaxID=379075 RepID=A0A315ZFL7_SEDFL|nr:hypothetical protein [Sediminitomix flava]PWJ44112.1 hypothetical protein BC781_101462 [Sediminitomix flava]
MEPNKYTGVDDKKPMIPKSIWWKVGVGAVGLYVAYSLLGNVAGFLMGAVVGYVIGIGSKWFQKSDKK